MWGDQVDLLTSVFWNNLRQNSCHGFIWTFSGRKCSEKNKNHFINSEFSISSSNKMSIKNLYSSRPIKNRCQNLFALMPDLWNKYFVILSKADHTHFMIENLGRIFVPIVRSFVRSFIRSFVRLFVRSFVHSLVRSLDF